MKISNVANYDFRLLRFGTREPQKGYTQTTVKNRLSTNVLCVAVHQGLLKNTS